MSQTIQKRISLRKCDMSDSRRLALGIGTVQIVSYKEKPSLIGMKHVNRIFRFGFSFVEFLDMINTPLSSQMSSKTFRYQ